MKKKYPILKTLGITAGLNLVITGDLYLFSHLIRNQTGQALLFLSITLLLIAGACLFARVPVSGRGSLWGCMGISMGLHLPLSITSALTGGKALSEQWPGGTGNNLAALLILLMSLSVWSIGIFGVTAARSRCIAAPLREERRNRKRITKGYVKEWQSLPPARLRLASVLRGFLRVLWTHLLTGLLFTILVELDLAETILGYVAFPMLWCLMIPAILPKEPLTNSPCIISAAVSHAILFALTTLLLSVRSYPNVIKNRGRIYTDLILNRPLDHPEQLLALGILTTGIMTLLILYIGKRKRTH
jgi:hypothetical protein